MGGLDSRGTGLEVEVTMTLPNRDSIGSTAYDVKRISPTSCTFGVRMSGCDVLKIGGLRRGGARFWPRSWPPVFALPALEEPVPGPLGGPQWR